MSKPLTGKELEYTGYIIDLKPWSSNKGFFVNIDSEAKDFYGFGSCPHEMGNTIKIHATPGTGKFSDKFEVCKITPVTDTELKDYKEAKTFLPDKKPEPEQIIRPRIDINDSIIQQCCLKAAANLAGQIFMGREMNSNKDIATLGKQVLQFKKMFYEDITGKKKQEEGQKND